MPTTQSDFDPSCFGSQYDDAPQTLHFQFEGVRCDNYVYRYVLVDKFRPNKINARSKKTEEENNELLTLALIAQSMYTQNNEPLQNDYTEMASLMEKYHNSNSGNIESGNIESGNIESGNIESNIGGNEPIGQHNNEVKKSLEQSQLENLLQQTINEIEKGSEIIKNLTKSNNNKYGIFL